MMLACCRAAIRMQDEEGDEGRDSFKMMDLDGSKVYVKTIGDKTRADGVQRVRADSSTPPAAGR